MAHILQIVPRLPPSGCGVGDYSLILARALEQNHDIATRFLVGDPDWKQGEAAPPFPVHVVRKRNPVAFIEAATRDDGLTAVILQYSGYGFSKRGAPLWLLRGLRHLRRRHPGIPLVTTFHELYAIGPVTSSAFWLSRLQRYIARGLAHLSSNARSSGRVVADILLREMGVAPSRLVTQPVFSNLGEARVRKSFEAREDGMVVFSSNIGPRGDSLVFWNEFTALCHLTPIKTIRVIGRELKMPKVDGIRIEQSGFLNPDQASVLLSDTRYAFIDYRPSLLAKSGLFAAAAAHGVVSVIPGEEMGLTDGLVAGRHYLDRQTLVIPRSAQQRDQVSHEIFQWYKSHSIQATAASYEAALRVAAN